MKVHELPLAFILIIIVKYRKMLKLLLTNLVFCLCFFLCRDLLSALLLRLSCPDRLPSNDSPFLVSSSSPETSSPSSILSTCLSPLETISPCSISSPETLSGVVCSEPGSEAVSPDPSCSVPVPLSSSSPDSSSEELPVKKKMYIECFLKTLFIINILYYLKNKIHSEFLLDLRLSIELNSQ